MTGTGGVTMDYQEVIEWINERKLSRCENCLRKGNEYCGGNCRIENEVMKIAISAMQELQEYKQLGTLEEVREAVEKQKWIPCSERSPENISTVIVKVKEIEKPTIGWYGNMSGWRLTERDFEELKDFTVIAWMPLPNLYREDDV